MKSFMESQFLSFILNWIREVVDFKTFIKSYVEKLVGLNVMYIIRFFMDNNT